MFFLFFIKLIFVSIFSLYYSMRIQSLLYMRLYKLKKDNVMRNVKARFFVLSFKLCTFFYFVTYWGRGKNNYYDRAVFKWLSKVNTWLRLLRLVIGLKRLAPVFQPIAPCQRDFSRASSELQVIARNCDWFMALFVRVVIGRSNCFGFGFGFSTVIWKPL